jgi:hypothetical protein
MIVNSNLTFVERFGLLPSEALLVNLGGMFKVKSEIPQAEKQ